MPPARAKMWIRAWWPAVFWAGVIWLLSTEYFSSDSTQAALHSFARRLLPSLSAETIALLNHYFRKAAHSIEYFVFCLLLFRGLRRERRGWRWTWAFAAFTLAAGYSALDEIHQSFVEERTASLYDFLHDSAGALFATLARCLWTRARTPRLPEPMAEQNLAADAVRADSE